jgi:hypothetical protein
MNRSIWISAGASSAILVIPLLAAGQKAAVTIETPLPAAAQGQPADLTNETYDLCQCIGEGDSPLAAKIEKALRGQLKPQGLHFADAPLEEVAAVLQETYGIPVQMDSASLDEIGIDPQEPVTVSLHGISLRSALRLMLKQLGLTYIIQNEVLLITTPEAAESELTTCVYDVRDLLHRKRSGVDFDSLIDMIISCIAVETWAENGGGESDIRPLQPGFLVVSQAAAVHEEIQELLNSIRELKQIPVAAAAIVDPNASLDELVTEWNVRQ